MSDNQPSKRTPKFYDYILNERLRDLLGNSRTADFADALGITSESVRQWTAGYSRPDMDKLATIAEYFNCTTDYLLGLSEFPNIVKRENFSEKNSEIEQRLLRLESIDRDLFLQFFYGFLDVFELSHSKSECIKYSRELLTRLKVCVPLIIQRRFMFYYDIFESSTTLSDEEKAHILMGFITTQSITNMLTETLNNNIIDIKGWLDGKHITTKDIEGLDTLLRNQSADLINRYGVIAKEGESNADT